MLQFHGLTDIGRSRRSNQDVWTALPAIGFFALADGMGGRKGGEIAARETIHSLCESIRRLADETHRFRKSGDLVCHLREAIAQANHWVFRMGQGSANLSGMGTTLCCILWTQELVYYAHVGDSRIYRFRNGNLELLTHDHSLWNRWLARKNAKLPSPPKNIITRAVGTSLAVEPEIACCTADPGDLFFLCSDGLSDALEEREMERILSSSDTIETAAQNMIERAKIKGSGDNITVLIVQNPHDANLSRS